MAQTLELITFTTSPTCASCIGPAHIRPQQEVNFDALFLMAYISATTGFQQQIRIFDRRVSYIISERG